jgi:hypothetical protein
MCATNLTQFGFILELATAADALLFAHKRHHWYFVNISSFTESRIIHFNEQLKRDGADGERSEMRKWCRRLHFHVLIVSLILLCFLGD